MVYYLKIGPLFSIFVKQGSYEVNGTYRNAKFNSAKYTLDCQPTKYSSSEIKLIYSTLGKCYSTAKEGSLDLLLVVLYYTIKIQRVIAIGMFPNSFLDLIAGI